MAKIEYDNVYLGKHGDIFPGVTTILGNLGWNKAALMAWAAKMARQGKDYKEVSKEAAGTGTLAHYLAECYLEGIGVDADTLGSYEEKQVKHAYNALDALKEWQDGSKLCVYDTEVKVISNTFRYGGTCDVVFYKDVNEHKNIYEIGDFKTSNGTYADYILQLAGYANAFEEQKSEELGSEVIVERIHILRFGKGVKGVFHQSSWDRDTWLWAFKTFKMLRELHDVKEKLEELL